MTTKSRARWAEILLIGIYIALLWAPTFDTLLNLDDSRPIGENRLPAPFPKFSQFNFSSAQKFLNGFGDYFNDHFGFRKKLIRWFQNWKISFFRDRSVYKIVIGRDGWLFLSESQMVEHYLGLAKFSPVQLRDWQTLFEKRRDWLAQRGIQYLVVIPPNKEMIYPEKLPAWLTNALSVNRQTKLDQFLDYMKKNSTVRILDLRAPLNAAKKIAPTYLQTDTHWNLFGGFIALQELTKTLSQQISVPPALDLKNFIWTNVPARGGDLAQMLGSETSEKNYFKFTPKPFLPVLNFQTNKDFATPWGPRGLVRIENSAGPKATAIVFRDSFGLAWQPFLGYEFQRVIFLADNRSFDAKLISENPPTIVINEILERYFNTLDPQEMLKTDHLP
jgi:alginate O-acetyltransferase complex protein AlgJ